MVGRAFSTNQKTTVLPAELLRAKDIAPPLPRVKKRPSDAHDPSESDTDPRNQNSTRDTADLAGQKRPRTDMVEEEVEVKPEQTDVDDDNEDRVAFLQDKLLAQLRSTSKTLN